MRIEGQQIPMHPTHIQASSIHTTQTIPSRLTHPRFSKGWAGSMGNTIVALDSKLGFVHKSRFRQMVFEDIMGFCALRTLWDLCRQYVFKSTYNQKREFNFAAARERIMMELLGLAQAWIGLIGPAAAILANRGLKGRQLYSANIDTLDLFKSITKQSAPGSNSTFIQALAKQIDTKQASKLTSILENALLKGASADESAIAIAKQLKQPHLDVVINKQRFALNHLIEDASHFMQKLKSTASPSNLWKTRASQLLKKGLRVSWIAVPLAMGAGLIYDFLMPPLIHRITKKIDKTADYPGEMGLRKLNYLNDEADQQKRWFPYLSDSLKEGKIGPLLMALVPLPLALGLFSTATLATRGPIAAWMKPFTKGFAKRWVSLFQFDKRFPFATGQQISSVYAMLILSRMATARNGIEFRERAIDAYLGWTIWMLATPFLQLFTSKASDKLGTTQLIKTVGGQPFLKTEQEITRLIKDPAIRKATLRQFKLTRTGSFIATMILLGLVEPYISIRLTEWQSKRNKKKKQSKQSKQKQTPSTPEKKPAQETRKPLQTPLTPKPTFTPQPVRSSYYPTTPYINAYYNGYARPYINTTPFYYAYPIQPAWGYNQPYSWAAHNAY